MYRRRTNFGNIIVMRSETLAQSQETLRSRLNIDNNTGLISSYSELFNSLFSDFDFDYEIKDLEDDKLKQNLQKLKVMLEEYKEPYSFDFKENWDDSIILNDSRWLEIVNFAKNIINDINENPLE